MKSIDGGTHYQYNGIGQRVVKKPNNGNTRTYLYGQNGELLAEIGVRGGVFREYIYINSKPLALLEYTPSSNENFLTADFDGDGDGDVSVEDYITWYTKHFVTGDISKDINGDGVLDNTDINILISCILATDNCIAASYDTAIYYIHNDHLGTPKLMTNQTGQPVWRALATPFGKATVDEDVDGDGIDVVMNIRFPGQYYDAESGFFDDDSIRPDKGHDRNEYECDGKNHPDDKLKQAEKDVQKNWDMDWRMPLTGGWNNCQDYTDAVIDRFNQNNKINKFRSHIIQNGG